MSEEPFDLMGYIEEEEAEASSGGGLILEVQLDGVWIVFHTGHMDKSYWVFNGKDEGAEKKLLALDYIDEYGVLDKKGKTARPIMGVRLTQYGDTVLNRDEPLNWTDGEIAKNYARFWDSFKDFLRPSIIDIVGPDNQFQYGERFWARVGTATDPARPTYKNASGEEKDNLIAYIAEAFDGRKEALEATDSSDVLAFVNVPDKPELYSYPDWDSYARSIVKTYSEEPENSEKPDPPLSTFVSDEHGVTKKLVKKLRKEGLAQRAQDGDELPF